MYICVEKSKEIFNVNGESLGQMKSLVVIIK